MPIFPRRPMPRRWRAARRAGPAAQAALARLQRAHALLAQGNCSQAAAIFAELADQAAARSIPRAPQLNLQAGRAWILAGDQAQGMARLRRGLMLMAEMGQVGRLPTVSSRVFQDLRGRGLSAEADSLKAELRSAAPGLDFDTLPPSIRVPIARPRLPAKCPYCGGTVLPDCVEWLDEMSATCDYCGSVVQAEA